MKFYLNITSYLFPDISQPQFKRKNWKMVKDHFSGKQASQKIM
jgi:hypothetical protein